MPSKEKGSGIDQSTAKDIIGMVSKWVSIPFGILVVLVAGGTLNLVPYFLEIKDKLGFSPLQQELVRWGVLLGYFGGILSGPLVDIIGTTVAFPIAAFISGGGYVALGFYTDSSKVNTFNTILIVSLLVVVAFGASIAVIAAISTVIKNFSRNVGAMIAAVMIAYLYASNYLDLCVRKGYFSDVTLKTNMFATAGYTFLIYILAGFIIDENHESDEMKKASNLTDRFGVLVYAGICAGALAAIYFTWIVAEDYKLGVFFMLLIILINFIALGFTIQALLGKINAADTKNVDVGRNPAKKNFIQMFGDIRYYIVIFGTFVVVGTGYTFMIESPSVAAAISKKEIGKDIFKSFWISAVAAILGGGLVAGLFARLINQWLFAAVAAFSGAAGFTFVFLANSYGGFWLFLSTFFVGAATGGWWIIVPQIILDDAGPSSFESLWGFTLSVNVGGMFAFERFFYWINKKIEPSKDSDCKGVSCFLIPYIVAGALCLIVGLLCFVALANDEGSGGRGSSEKKSLRDNDKNKSSDKAKSSKSKSREKSNEKPAKSREKSKGKK